MEGLLKPCGGRELSSKVSSSLEETGSLTKLKSLSAFSARTEALALDHPAEWQVRVGDL